LDSSQEARKARNFANVLFNYLQMPTNDEVVRLTDFLEIVKTVVPAFSQNTSDQVVVTMLAETLIQQLLRKGITE
jgi:hypothetical protein